MTNYNSGVVGLETLYAIPNRRLTFLPAEAPLRQGAYRALAGTANLVCCIPVRSWQRLVLVQALTGS